MKCKNCKTKFEPKYFLQKFCLSTDECRTDATNFAIEQKEKNFKKDRVKDTKERKEALMSYSEWLNLFQVTFNTYIRMRDKGKPCVSCGCAVDNGHASHMFSVGGNPNVRFNEDNVHLSCVECNLHLHGNLVEYTLRLPERIGKERFEKLVIDSKQTVLKLSIPEIKEKIKFYKEKIRLLK